MNNRSDNISKEYTNKALHEIKNKALHEKNNETIFTKIYSF